MQMTNFLQMKNFLPGRSCYIFLLLLFIFNSCGFFRSTDEEQTNLIGDGSAANIDLVIAFGSCNKQDLPQPLWEPILQNNPDVFIWGGDNIYADTDDMEEMANFYSLQKSQENYAKLISSTSILATWDDHDYGKNDAGAEYEFKQESQQNFLDFVDVPVGDERRSREGIYHSANYETGNGTVKIILLDTRYFRSPLVKSEDAGKRYDADAEGTILGRQQWQWLEEELKNSTAKFNIIVSSIQFLSAEHGFETWANFPAEVEKLKRLIVEAEAENVVILSGDRHISEFSKTELAGLDYPLVDFTSSGLTHTYTSYTGEPNRYREGEVISDLSFGLLFLDLKNSSIKMQMRGEGNKLQQELIQAYK